MMLTNESAHRATAGAGETQRAGSGLRFYPQYTALFDLMQRGAARLMMRFALLCVNIGDALAGAALRWELGL